MDQAFVATAQLAQQAKVAFEAGESRKAIMLLNAAEAELDGVRDAQQWLGLWMKIDHIHAKYILGINLERKAT